MFDLFVEEKPLPAIEKQLCTSNATLDEFEVWASKGEHRELE